MSWYREPLLHFLTLGVALFVVHALVVGDATQDSRAIILDATLIEHLASEFADQWDRPPSQEELDSLIEGYLREEVLYREALALGLDRGDAIIRLQLVEKMKFFSIDPTALTEPTDEELEIYLTSNQNRYRSPARVTLDLVYFSTDQRGNKTYGDAATALAKLQADPSTETEGLGDPATFQSRYTRLSDEDATRIFGRLLADRIFELHPDRWHGPFESSGGFQLIRTSEGIADSLPGLETLRRKLRRDLLAQRAKDAEDALFVRLSHGYDIRIERPLASTSHTDTTTQTPSP